MAMELTRYEFDELIELNNNDDTNDGELKVVERSEWEDDGKVAYMRIVVKDAVTNKHYIFHIHRTGSYYTDFDYDMYDYPREVKAKQVIKTVWVSVD